jgi:UDP:flavonoid glycosyltransferase YjiC (YdhE family)
MKKISLVTMGTEGDVRPLIAMACNLRDHGYEALVCAGPNYGNLCEKYRVNFASFGFDVRETTNSAKIDNNQQLVKGMRGFKETALRQFIELAETVKGSDFLIGAGALLPGSTVAEYCEIPYRHVYHAPVVLPSRYYAPVFFPWQGLPQWANSFLWKTNSFMLNKFLGGIIKEGREKLGLKPIGNFMDFFYQNVIIAADFTLAPIPDDVKNNYIQTGYWHLDDEQDLDPELLRFIESGEPPIYIGFGSMTGISPQKAQCLLAGLSSSNHRYLVLKGWADLGGSFNAPNIKIIENIPHHKLFPKMAVVIHHGGAGTTHTAARAGVPQIIVPHMMDQFFWGERIFQLQLGPHPLKKSALSSKHLLAAVDEILTNRDIRYNAAEFGETLRTRDGLSEALNYIQKFV